jgi:antitoxin VapB
MRVDASWYIPYIHVVNATTRTHTFKSGNSIAVRLPKGFGLKAGEPVDLVRKGNKIEIQVGVDAKYERDQLAKLLAELDALGPVEGAENARDDGRIEFPIRPGLY